MFQESLSAKWLLTEGRPVHGGKQLERHTERKADLLPHFLGHPTSPIPCTCTGLKALDFSENSYNWAIFKTVKIPCSLYVGSMINL